MKIKCHITLMLILCVIITMFPTQVMAIENDTFEQLAHNTAVSWLNDNSEEYYTLRNVSADVYRTFELENTIKYYILITYETRLKVSSAAELPYIQGLKSSISSATAKKSLTSIHQEKLHQVISAKVAELNRDYIGVYTPASIDIVVEINPATLNVILYYYDIVSTTQYPIEILEHDSDIMRQNGIHDANALIATFTTSSTESLRSITGCPNYSQNAARDYANTYSSNVVSCECGSSSCVAKYDSDYWNSDYTGHPHSDCANFVSQCLHAGGIPTDNTWYAESSSWIGVANLIEYMVDEGYVNSSTYAAACKGDIVRWTDSSHVALITYNDTIEHRYTGHTRDRKDLKFSHTSQLYYAVNTSS